jgi:large subunit ribosomal protein L35
MPKVKTNKSAAKRFRVSGNGKFKRHHAYSRHLRSAKTSKRRRGLRQGQMVDPTNERAVHEMLPYS